MKVSLGILKNTKKRAITKGGAPQIKKVISKKPQVALGGPLTFSKAPTLVQERFNGFVEKNQTPKDQMETIKADTKISEELKKASKEHEAKLKEE